MAQNDIKDSHPPIAWAWMGAPLLAVLAVHLAVLGRYGIGCDELWGRPPDCRRILVLATESC